MTTRVWFRNMRRRDFNRGLRATADSGIGVIFRTGYPDSPHTRTIWLYGPIQYQELIDTGIDKHIPASADSDEYRRLRVQMWKAGYLV